jgi:hypothetical protein
VSLLIAEIVTRGMVVSPRIKATGAYADNHLLLPLGVVPNVGHCLMLERVDGSFGMYTVEEVIHRLHLVQQAVIETKPGMQMDSAKVRPNVLLIVEFNRITAMPE